MPQFPCTRCPFGCGEPMETMRKELAKEEHAPLFQYKCNELTGGINLKQFASYCDQSWLGHPLAVAFTEIMTVGFAALNKLASSQEKLAAQKHFCLEFTKRKNKWHVLYLPRHVYGYWAVSSHSSFRFLNWPVAL